MTYLTEKNDLWKEILKKRTSKTTIPLPNELLLYLSNWNFTFLDYDDVFDEDLSGEFEEGIHCGIRYFSIDINGINYDFTKKENYIFSDFLDEWTINSEDFESYLIKHFILNIDQVIWTLETIDELIFTI